MKTHYCLVEKTQITYEGECSWCGDKETVTFGKHHKQMMNVFKPRELSDEEIHEVINRTAWVGTEEEIRFKIAKAILEKASEK